MAVDVDGYEMAIDGYLMVHDSYVMVVQCLFAGCRLVISVVRAVVVVGCRRRRCVASWF